MKKIKTLFRRVYLKIAVITSDKTTRRIARQMFLNYMNENQFRYRISNDQSLMESGFEIAKGQYTNVYYDFSPGERRIVVQSHFWELQTHQIPTAALLIAHLNTLLRNGKLMINFQKLIVYFELDANHAAILLSPENLDNFHRHLISLPKDFLWCFEQVLETNEDPVVVMGEFMRKHGI